MLYGDLMESVNKEVELKEINADCFELILSYIYTGKINLKNLTVNIVLISIVYILEFHINKYIYNFFNITYLYFI